MDTRMVLSRKTQSNVISYDSQCPECQSDAVRRKDTFDIAEVDMVSVWCDDCGWGWSEDV